MDLKYLESLITKRESELTIIAYSTFKDARLLQKNDKELNFLKSLLNKII